MSKIYNKAFKVGFSFAIFIFVILNIVSFAISSQQCEELNRQFSSLIYCSWGFPANIDTTEGLITNGFAAAICSFTSGFLVKYVWAEMPSRH